MGDAKEVWIGMSDPAVIPQSIRRYVQSYVAKRRRVALIRSVGLAAAIAILWLLFWAIFDRLLPMPSAIRSMLLLANICLFAWTLARPIRAMLTRRFDWHVA